MKRLNYVFATLFAMLLLTFTSCDKNDEATVLDPSSELIPVTFDLSNVTSQTASKDSDKTSSYPECSDEAATSVFITIDDIDYTLSMTDLGTNETEVLKLPSGTHIVSSFAVMDAQGNAIYVAPAIGSDAATIYGLKGLPFDLIVPEFNKHKEAVDVICYNPASYSLFGYAWFQYKVYEENEIFLWGNICSKFFDTFHLDTQANPYFGQLYDGYDFAAIFKASITKNGIVVASSDNITAQGVGEAGLVALSFINDPVLDEDFRLIIELVLPDNTTEVIYDEDLPDGSLSVDGDVNGFGGADGVFDFVIGNCDTEDNNDIDLELPAWIPVATTGDFMLSGGLYGSHGGYIGITFDNLDVQHDDTIKNGVQYASFCGAEHDNISTGVWYTANFYSSLGDLSSLPDTRYADLKTKLGILNWIVNNIDGSNWTAQEIQAAIWHFTESKGGSGNAIAQLAVSNASYVPKVGGWAVIICDAIEDDSQTGNYQLMMVRVDP